MMPLVITLILIDVILFSYIIYHHNQNSSSDVNLLTDITAERTLIKNMADGFHEQIRRVEHNCKSYLDKIIHTAAELEQEKKFQNGHLNEQIESIIKEIAPKLQTSLTAFSEKQLALESLLQRLEKERNLLTNAMNRGERLLNFFNKDMPYEQVMEEIEIKKYSDARQLIAKGYTIEQIAKELGISKSEVELVRNVAS